MDLEEESEMLNAYWLVKEADSLYEHEVYDA